MELTQPFDPIAPGEFDNFAFNFTPDVGSNATVVSTTWTCSLKPQQTVPDPLPQSHIVAAYVQTQIGSDVGPLTFAGPSLVLINGVFSVARIGGFTPAQAGATYSLAATVTTSDGRIVSLCADLPISQC